MRLSVSSQYIGGDSSPRMIYSAEFWRLITSLLRGYKKLEIKVSDSRGNVEEMIFVERAFVERAHK